MEWIWDWDRELERRGMKLGLDRDWRGGDGARFVAGDTTGENLGHGKNGPAQKSTPARARGADTDGEGRGGVPGQAGKGGRASPGPGRGGARTERAEDRKSTRLNSSH